MPETTKKRVRLRDIPLIGMDCTAYPYLLGTGVLSDVAGMVPYQKGGYKRVPQWAAHYLIAGLQAGASIIGCSKAGPITTGGTAQITVAYTPNVSGFADQARILANGTAAGWGGPNTLQANQNMPTKVCYHRKGELEYTIGWSPTSPAYGCLPFQSLVSGLPGMYPVGTEPMSHTGVTLTPATTGGKCGKGWIRVYLAFEHNLGTQKYGATDHVTYLDKELTGTTNANNCTVASIPVGAWTYSTAKDVYRTKVCADQVQLALEPAYFVTRIANATTSVDVGLITDAALITGKEMDIGKYTFPYASQASKWLSNIGMCEHKGHLLVWGCGRADQVQVSGYLDVDNVTVRDDNFFGFSLEMPEHDTVLSCVSLGRRLVIYGQNRIYIVRDEDDNPDNWKVESVADIRGENVSAFMLAGDTVFAIGRDATDEWNVYAFDGYEMQRVGDNIRATLGSDTQLVSVDGLPICTVTTAADKRVLYARNAWGRGNYPASCKWPVGRYSTFRSGAPMLANALGVYYEGSAYSADGSDYFESREYILDPEEYSEWDKIYIHGVKLSATDVSAKVYASIDGGAYAELTDVSPITFADTGRGIYEVGLRAELYRNAKRIKIKVTFNTAAGAAVTGITIQGTPTAWRE